MTKTRFANYCTQQERVLLICPLCRAGLEAVQLHKDENGDQTIWWVCKNTFDDKCTFPGDIPPEVFWVKRSAEETEAGKLPRPNLDKLPENFRHLYPSLFPVQNDNTLESSGPSRSASSLQQDFVEDDDVRNASLVSELGTFDSRPASACNASVITVAPVPLDQTTGGSNSYSTGTSQSVASGATAVVPGPSSSQGSRKRPASSPSKLSRNPHFNQALSEHFLTLKEQGIDTIQLREIARKLMEEANLLDEAERKKRQLIPLITQDEYTDAIFQNVPEVRKEQVAAAVKQKPLAQRMKLANMARHTSSGAGLLKMIGLAGSPLPESNTWRVETNDQVSANLRNAARETRKALARQKTKQMTKEPQSNPKRTDISEPRAPIPSTVDSAKRQQQEEELTLKTTALINSKIRSIKEVQRQQQQLQKKRRVEDQAEKQRLIDEQLQRLKDMEPNMRPVHDTLVHPLTQTSRERQDSFSAMEYDPLHDNLYDPLHDNLHDHFHDTYHEFQPTNEQDNFPSLDEFDTGEPFADLFAPL